MKVFVAGATGAIGKCLVPRLLERGHEVVGTTRSSENAQRLRASGVEGIVLDGLDRVGVMRAVAQARPDVIVDELTALAEAKNLKRLDQEFVLTNRLRTEGLDHLLAAARANGTRRVVVQSFTGPPNIREGGPIKTETDPLDSRPPAGMSQTVAAIRSLESRVTAAGSGFEGLALRYGGLYGPGTSLSEDGIYSNMVRKRLFAVIGNGAGIWSFIHVDDAAAATVAAVERGAPGLYNIVDDEPAPVSEWLPYLAEALGAKPPRHFPLWLGRLLMGEIGVSMMTQIRGSSNAKAKRELSWRPFYASWRDGFRHGLSSRPSESNIDSIQKAA
jgi:nucleoside-diphosphate-sugar epimerase